MLRILLIFIFCTSVAPAKADDTIPPSLIGVWVSESARLNGPYLIEGQAIYLGADGVGAFVGGPPPIGVKMVAKFDSASNTLEYDVYVGTQRGPHGKIAYEPKSQTLESDASGHKPLHRIYDVFTDENKKALGISR